MIRTRLRQWSCAAMMMAVSLVVVGAVAWAQDGVATKDDDADVRLKYMMDSLARFAVHFDVNETPGAELVPKPALRWTNTISSTHDGMVGVYAKDAGRPDAVVQFSLKGD